MLRSLSAAIILLISTVFFAFSSAFASIPSWYLHSRQNNNISIYGVGEGYSVEEATKAALAGAAASLVVSISSESNLVREENNTSSNDEIRQNIKQNIEKIDFVNFEVSNSDQFENKFYVEVSINKDKFIKAQKDKIFLLDRQIKDLQSNISSQNLIQKRNSLTRIIDFAKQNILLTRIVEAAGESSNLQEKLIILSNAQNNLDKLSDKIDFYFVNNEKEKAIFSIIKNSLNKEKIKISSSSSNSSEQIKLEVNSSVTSNKIYGVNITKISINFQNKSLGKIIASNSVEVSGSSTISEKEAYSAALEGLKDQINQDGILKVIGIISGN